MGFVKFFIVPEWKITTSKTIADLQMNKTKETKDELMKNLRDKAWHLYKEVRILSRHFERINTKVCFPST
jgi:hypothetical protein